MSYPPRDPDGWDDGKAYWRCEMCGTAYYSQHAADVCPLYDDIEGD